MFSIENKKYVHRKFFLIMNLSYEKLLSNSKVDFLFSLIQSLCLETICTCHKL